MIEILRMINGMFGLIFSTVFLLFLFVVSLRIGIFNKKNQKKYREYLTENEGQNYFCYNNRRKGHDFIVSKVLPSLPENITPVFLNGKRIEPEDRNMSKIFYSFRNYSRFPHLVKIRNGQVLDRSINSTFYRCLDQNLDLSEFFEEVNSFFEIR